VIKNHYDGKQFFLKRISNFQIAVLLKFSLDVKLYSAYCECESIIDIIIIVLACVDFHHKYRNEYIIILYLVLVIKYNGSIINKLKTLNVLL